MKHILELELILMLLIKLTRVFKSIDMSELYELKQDELSSIDSDLFDELAPKHLRYKTVMQVLLNSTKRDQNFIFKLDEIINKIKLTQASLTLVGRFIREHKFYERDWRKFQLNLDDFPLDYYDSMFLKNKQDLKPYFMYKFPNPPIVNEYPEVADKCNKSALSCINYISSIVGYLINPYIDL